MAYLGTPKVRNVREERLTSPSHKMGPLAQELPLLPKLVNILRIRYEDF